MKKKMIYGLCFTLVMVGFVSFDTVRAQTAEAQENSGTIKGVVNTPWVKRYPALVYIDRAPGEYPPKENSSMSQKGMVFQPHVLPVLKDSTVDFTNDDTVSHNVFSPPGSAVIFNLGIYGSSVKKTQLFDKLGEVPLLCSVHPEMSAFVVVLQNPFFALTDNSGNFEIKNVPAGTYQLKVWHEKLKESSQQVIIEVGKTISVEFKDLTKR
jgi:plastocyanin